jgi:hypothetical protein
VVDIGDSTMAAAAGVHTAGDTAKKTEDIGACYKLDAAVVVAVAAGDAVVDIRLDALDSSFDDDAASVAAVGQEEVAYYRHESAAAAAEEEGAFVVAVAVGRLQSARTLIQTSDDCCGTNANLVDLDGPKGLLLVGRSLTMKMLMKLMHEPPPQVLLWWHLPLPTKCLARHYPLDDDADVEEPEPGE